ncbi:hypothetical protein ABZ816_28710 [Actinosynnema sp. NPDC047251]|uniref:hypothetical protein n=1 Tax=Saccharothrix espanaensis TaxID=103731 RepID=UPI0011DC755A|nr:hypothetical protein [Saccharothrix espanaensis]
MSVKWSWARIVVGGEASATVTRFSGYFDTQQEVLEDLQAHFDAGAEGSTELLAAAKLREAGWSDDLLIVAFRNVAAWIAYAVPEEVSSEQVAWTLAIEKNKEIHEKLVSGSDSWVTQGSGCMSVVLTVLSVASALVAAWSSSGWGA